MVFIVQSKRSQGEVQLEQLLSEGEEKCVNKPCVQSEQCCPGSVCVDVDENRGMAIVLAFNAIFIT